METVLVTPASDHPPAPALRQLLLARPFFSAPEAISFDDVGSLTPPAPGIAFVLVGDEYSSTALAAIRRLRENGTKHVLAVGTATDPKLILRAIQAGADVFLDDSDLELELELAITRLQLRQADVSHPQQVLAVLDAAGGCGASTLAVNLAVLTARAHGRCNLIDLNHGKADLAPLLDLKPQYTLADLCRNDGRLDGSLFDKLLTRHDSGVSLLAAPSEMADGAITPRGVSRAVGLAREAFREVVIDVMDCRHAEQWPALEQATRILLVTRLTFTAVRSARRVLDQLIAHEIPRERVDIVANQVGLPNEVLPADAAEAIGRPVTLLIPHDPEAMNGANNVGVPVAICNSTAAVVSGMAKVIGLDKPADDRKGRIGRLAVEVCGRVGSGVLSLYKRLARGHQPPVAPPVSEPAPVMVNDASDH